MFLGCVVFGAEVTQDDENSDESRLQTTSLNYSIINRNGSCCVNRESELCDTKLYQFNVLILLCYPYVCYCCFYSSEVELDFEVSWSFAMSFLGMCFTIAAGIISALQLWKSGAMKVGTNGTPN